VILQRKASRKEVLNISEGESVMKASRREVLNISEGESVI